MLIVTVLSSLVGLLAAAIAGVALLVTGRYPPSVHALVVGTNRWMYRVAAYASLMTDAYPPFRLDAGSAPRAASSSERPRSVPVAVEADGPVWTTILETADQLDAATIVMGAHGHIGPRSMLLGSVSSAVLHHTDRPTPLSRQPVAGWRLRTAGRR